MITLWRTHHSSKSNFIAPRDFQKLNRMSLRDRAITSTEQYKFRQDHDARIPFATKMGDHSSSLPSISFGRPSMLSDHVATVIANVYGEQAETS